MADPLALAGRLLDEARTGRSDATTRGELASLDPDELATALADDASRIAFWLNVYNAAVRSRILADRAAYRRRWRFFATPAVEVAGHRLSPNAIEHGILRRSVFVIGLGYVRNPLPSSFERRMRVSEVDPRIHFALNCGARSCPPFAAWNRTTLDEDLERATSTYLASESQRSPDGRAIRVPRLLLWFRGDFGGRGGIIRLLRRHGLVAPGQDPDLQFGPYDWTLDIAEHHNIELAAGGSVSPLSARDED